MQLVLRVAGILGVVISVIWWFADPGYDPLYAFITGIAAFLGSFVLPEQGRNRESLDQRNRRVMLNHVENFWVRGVLEKSLHGAALLELGIKEEPSAVSYPWTIKKETTDEILPVGKSMLEIFHEVGMGRSLLILGAPGSGKTTMLLELARQLIERARHEDTEPVPVVFNLASWKEDDALADWLAEQLGTVYRVPKKIAPAWISENQMLLLLDGLDEVKQVSRAKCVEAINYFRKGHGLTSMVVCSRIEDYSIIGEKLSLDGAIALQPLTSKQIKTYFDRLGATLGGIRRLLKEDKALRELAETPLMLSIMILAYKDRKVDEWLVLRDRDKRRNHLLDTYVTHMFEHSIHPMVAPFSKQQTLHSVHWLAFTMTKHNTINYEIETMQPSWLEEESQDSMYAMNILWTGGLIIGLTFGLAATLILGPIAGVVLGWISGWMGGIMAAEEMPHEITMKERLKWSWKGAGFGLIFGLFLVLVSLLVQHVPGVGMPPVDLSIMLIIGVTILLMCGLGLGFQAQHIEETTHTGQRLKQTFFNALFVVTSVLVIVGTVVGLIDRPGVGLGIGLIAALILAMSNGIMSLLQHYSLRLVLARYKMLPWRLIPFLDHAVDLVFLRRVGGSYIFVHRLLMEHFAEMDV
jgi:DNA polymerase III delta prime subunit